MYVWKTFDFVNQLVSLPEAAEKAKLETENSAQAASRKLEREKTMQAVKSEKQERGVKMERTESKATRSEVKRLGLLWLHRPFGCVVFQPAFIPHSAKSD